MQIKTLFSLFTLIGYFNLSGQDSTLVTIKTGQKVKDVLTAADIYHYSQFTNGRVLFKDGTKGAAKFNYNRLFDQMLFIDPKGDTLALADEKTIKFITINLDTFYFDQGYMRLIEGSVIKLTEKQTWIVADIRKVGTFNKPATTFAITSFDSYTNGSDAAKSKDLIMNEDIILRKETHYFIGDKFDHFVRANKKSILQLFNNRQQIIENYLKENNINFEKKDDLEKLARFLTRLD